MKAAIRGLNLRIRIGSQGNNEDLNQLIGYMESVYGSEFTVEHSGGMDSSSGNTSGPELDRNPSRAEIMSTLTPGSTVRISCEETCKLLKAPLHTLEEHFVGYVDSNDY